jgi:hypothetical protein
MEGWKDGRMEGWKDGRMEGWKDGRLRSMVSRLAPDFQRIGHVRVAVPFSEYVAVTGVA